MIINRRYFLLSALFIFMGFLIVQSTPAFAANKVQDGDDCGSECACEGWTTERLLSEYDDNIAGYFYDDDEAYDQLPLCVRKAWWDCKGLGLSKEECFPSVIRSYGDEACAACRGENEAPTSDKAAQTPEQEAASTSKPDPTATPTIIPSPTATEGDVSIDKILVVQSVEGATLVSHHKTLMRVFINWPFDQPGELEIKFRVAGEDATKKFTAKKSYIDHENSNLNNSANIEIPRRLLQPGPIAIEAEIEKMPSWVTDTNRKNNRLSKYFDFQRSPILRIAYTTVHPDIKDYELRSYIKDSLGWMNALYPSRNDIKYTQWCTHVNDPNTQTFFAVWNLDTCLTLTNTYRQKKGLVLADYLVGVYPSGYYDSEGAQYWWAPNAVLVDITEPKSVPHEIGHTWFGDEYPTLQNAYQNEPQPLPNDQPFTALVWDDKDWYDLNYFQGEVNNFMTDSGSKYGVLPEVWEKLLYEIEKDYGFAGNDHFSGQGGMAAQVLISPVDSLLVGGLFFADGTVEVSPPLRVDLFSQSAAPDDDLKLELLNASGQTVSTAGVKYVMDGEGNGYFLGHIPVLGNPSQVALKSQGQIIWQKVFSANPPQASIALSGGETAPSGIFNLQVTTSDPDGDKLAYTLFYSQDNGQTWFPLMVNLTQEQVELDAQSLPGCQQCQLMVEVSDGWNLTRAQLPASFSISDKPPEVSILYPLDEARLSPGMVTMEAIIFDLENENFNSFDATGNQITWHSSLDGDLGNSTDQFQSLSPGAHILTATYQDQAGNIATDQVNINIVPATGELEQPDQLSWRGLLSFPGFISRLSGSIFLICGGLAFAGMISVILIGRATRSRGRSTSGSPPPESLPNAPPESLPIAPPESLPNAPPDSLPNAPPESLPNAPPEENSQPDFVTTERSAGQQTPDETKTIWKLVVVSGFGVGDSHALDGQVSVGRSPKNNITIGDDSSVSDHHAIFQIGKNCPEVFDLNSSSGVYVNEKLIQQTAQLQAGDLVKFGKTVFVIQRSI